MMITAVSTVVIPQEIRKWPKGDVRELSDPGHSCVSQAITEFSFRKIDDDLPKGHAYRKRLNKYAFLALVNVLPCALWMVIAHPSIRGYWVRENCCPLTVQEA